MNFTNPIARMTTQARIREASSQRSLRDADAVPRWHLKIGANGKQVEKICQNVEQLQRELNRLRRRVGGGEPPTRQLGGFKGEWSNTTNYTAGDIVLYTPSGGQAGAYGCAETPAAGLYPAPDTGAPYWMAFPMQTPAVWA